MRAQQTRVRKFWLEVERGHRIPDEHPVLPWIVEHPAAVLNRSGVCQGGSTAYWRLKGKDVAVKGIAFGERVLFRRKPLPSRLSNLSILWGGGPLGHAGGERGDVRRSGARGPCRGGRAVSGAAQERRRTL